MPHVGHCTGYELEGHIRIVTAVNKFLSTQFRKGFGSGIFHHNAPAGGSPTLKVCKLFLLTRWMECKQGSNVNLRKYFP